ncbi:hypothetical protein ACNKHR_15955 [Shigella flexneri]
MLDQVTDYYLKNEKANVESVFRLTALASAARHKNAGMAFVESETVGRA